MMSNLEATEIQALLPESARTQLDALEAFPSVDSTNTYLMSQAAPAAGRFRVAVADHQTDGRGRHYRRWISPPGSGLYMSISYTFATMPEQLPGLTLALGVGVIDGLTDLKVGGVSLKWPNDIVAQESKLGGILTEVRPGDAGGVTVVTGIGLNVHLRERLDFGAESDWAHRAIDLHSVVNELPRRKILAGAIIESLFSTFVRFEAQGFAGFIEDWLRYDWLTGREITVDMPNKRITGIAAGVDEHGALLVDGKSGQTRVVSGSIVMARPGEFGQ